ncbi:unnamed protein product [Arctogadus glacialis]
MPSPLENGVDGGGVRWVLLLDEEVSVRINQHASCLREAWQCWLSQVVLTDEGPAACYEHEHRQPDSRNKKVKK